MGIEIWSDGNAEGEYAIISSSGTTAYTADEMLELHDKVASYAAAIIQYRALGKKEESEGKIGK